AAVQARPGGALSALADRGRRYARERARGLLSSTALVRSGDAVALLAGACLAATSARAQDATWSTNPGSSTFTDPNNWSPATVPTGTAFFGATTNSTVDINVGGATSLSGFTFNAGAYDISVHSITHQFLSFTGAGIVINGGSVTITNSGVGGGGVIFQNSSSASSATIVNNSGGVTQFEDNSTAASANITAKNSREIRM